jgi:hypothetical protein
MEIEVQRAGRGVARTLAARLSALALLVPSALVAACGGGDGAASGPDEVATEKAALTADCDAIAAQLAQAEELANELLAEYQEAPPGPEKWRLLQLWKQARARVSQLRTQLDQCQNPPPPLPDLVAVNVVINKHLDGNAIDAAVLVRNDGQGSVSGPFNIVFAATYGTISAQITFPVPSTTTIAPGGSYTSDYMHNIAAVRDANGVATWRFDAIVDSDQIIAESNEGNNAFTIIVQDPPPGPPPPPPACPIGWSCCEPNDDGSCAVCIEPGQFCP